jgi:acyl-CoA synthetase (AMP-forming)/AMP-acid ligase II
MGPENVYANVTRLADLIRASARRQPSAPAIEFEGRTRTIGEVYAAGLSLANGFIASGLKEGDRVGILAENCPEFLETYLGCHLAGLVAVPVNFRLVADEVAYILGNCEARGLVVAKEYLPIADQARAGLPLLNERPPVVIGLPPTEPGSYARLISEHEPRDPCVPVSPLSPATIFYTSGTTGFPKGAVYSHLNVLSRFIFNGWEYGINADDVVLVSGPVFHMSYSSLALITLCAGGRVVLTNGLTGESGLETIERYGITWSFLVPKMLALLVEAAAARGARPNTASIRGFMSSGSPLSKVLLDGVLDTFPGVPIVDAYGWTEVGWITLCRHRDVVGRERTVGRAAFGCELAILDEEGRELPPGAVGDIYTVNPAPMLGYYGNPAATVAARRGRWETGGDLGFLDEEGFLHLADRKNDLIISGGENIYPAEIERILAQHPKVAELTVIGVPDENWGESPRAYVVPKPGEPVTASELITFCEGRLAHYKHPRSVEFLSALPRNAMGKVLRRELRNR